jgi:hypothetical protein
LGGAEAEAGKYSSGCYVFSLSFETDLTPGLGKIEERLGIGCNEWSWDVCFLAQRAIKKSEVIKFSAQLTNEGERCQIINSLCPIISLTYYRLLNNLIHSQNVVLPLRF